MILIFYPIPGSSLVTAQQLLKELIFWLLHDMDNVDGVSFSAFKDDVIILSDATFAFPTPLGYVLVLSVPPNQCCISLARAIMHSYFRTSAFQRNGI